MKRLKIYVLQSDEICGDKFYGENFNLSGFTSSSEIGSSKNFVLDLNLNKVFNSGHKNKKPRLYKSLVFYYKVDWWDKIIDIVKSSIVSKTIHYITLCICNAWNLNPCKLSALSNSCYSLLDPLLIRSFKLGMAKLIHQGNWFNSGINFRIIYERFPLFAQVIKFHIFHIEVFYLTQVSLVRYMGPDVSNWVQDLFET